MGRLPIPVVCSQQKGYTVYLGHITASQARQVMFADHYPPTLGRAGYQRPPDLRRAQSFAKFLLEDSAGFMTPILLNARGPIEFTPLKGQKDIGLIYLGEAGAAIVDGQHRSLGIQKFLGQENFPIPFMLFDELPIEKEEKLFTTINREQKRVSMSHVHFVARTTDPLAELVTRLESDHNSPWYGRVNLVGAKGTKRPVSLQSLRTAMESLLQSGEVKALTLEQQYAVALGFWRVVSQVWPEAWNSKRNSLLTKSMGTLAVAKLGGYLLPKCMGLEGDLAQLDDSRLSGYLSRVAGVNWMSNGSFQGFSGRHGADLVKHQLDALIFGQASE